MSGRMRSSAAISVVLRVSSGRESLKLISEAILNLSLGAPTERL